MKYSARSRPGSEASLGERPFRLSSDDSSFPESALVVERPFRAASRSPSFIEPDFSPAALTSNTATASDDAFATYNLFPSADCARAFGYVPPYVSPGKRVSRYRSTFASLTAITATASRFASATYNRDSSELNNSAVACDEGSIFCFGGSSEIVRATFPPRKSSSATADPFQSEHQARAPSRVATTP